MADTKTAPAKSKAPFLPGSIIWERKGPLPVWAWILILLGLVFAVAWWRRNQATAQADEAATGGVRGIYRDELPGDQTAPPIFVVPQAPVSPVTVLPPPPTVPAAPPAGGAAPPSTAPSFVQVPVNQNLYEYFTSQGTSFATVDALNPGWRTRDKSLQWYENPVKGGNKIPKLRTPLVLKVRQ